MAVETKYAVYHNDISNAHHVTQHAHVSRKQAKILLQKNTYIVENLHEFYRQASGHVKVMYDRQLVDLSELNEHRK